MQKNNDVQWKSHVFEIEELRQIKQVHVKMKARSINTFRKRKLQVRLRSLRLQWL